jgi:hypothetical protein
MERASLGDRWAFRAPARPSGRSNKRWAGFATLTVFFLVIVSAIAFADDISNNLDATVDAVAEIMPLNVGGSNGTTQLYVAPQNGDGKNGCNLTGSTTLVLSVSSSNTSAATVSPSSITFTSCGGTPTLTVTPVAQGSATISVSQTSNNTGGTFNLAPATFTVNVAPPANSAPSVAVSGVVGGASYDKGSVPSATCQVTDTEDGNSSFAATLSAITGPYASDGIGTQTASCSYTDGGGLTASASETYSIVDPSPPIIGYTLNPASPDGNNGWYKGDVTLTWEVTETESPNSLAKTGCDDQNITADQASTDYSCSATSAGGGAAQVTVSIKRDGTAPTVTYASASGTAGLNGWYTSDVVATFTATDALSGFAPLGLSTTTGTSTTTGEGSAVTVGSPAFTDRAGNTVPAGTATSVPFMIDKTAPAVSVTGVSNAAIYTLGSVPAAGCTTSDTGGSGVATNATSTVTGGSINGVGTFTASCGGAADVAGNLQNPDPVSVTYKVEFAGLSGILQPINPDNTSVFKRGQAIPVKFKLAGDEPSGFSTAGWTIQRQSQTCGAFDAADASLEAVGSNTPTTVFRYDAAADQYIFNADMKNLGVGTCWHFTVKLDSGQVFSSAVFQLTK